ncbi:carboxymuconolactone decarboxylase family protein [Mucilaginibacter psychrotolerans]|uniref:Carboxymuconolactone decarboxylase family protein n=1 Tax=Mucilaginibacter psychrotolerans TaxID=1524096 RepID=A0A4Y8SAU5_9SPHI|nr:carboxymuconolactone decarboxylase family protein [Mucilaginibacter psychrotolerans]TFF35781.1 carboxymuconolactone decarboxylase family protein [Mucilaginibacter psychrotolerans]
MAHINLENELPGIRGLMAYSPKTEAPLNALAEVLLRDDDNTLTRGDRELIGAYVSYLNDCFFCQNVHGALAGHYLGCNIHEIDAIKSDFTSAAITPKMKALLAIAASVQKGGKAVTEEQVAAARAENATDKEIHDTVLIAAAFCMFNRYVDGLATWAPQDRQFYVNRAPQRALDGYQSSIYK